MDANSTQSSGFYDLLAWLDANWKKVLIGAIGVVVVVAAIALYSWKQRQSEINANAALLSVAGIQSTNTLSPDALAKVAQEHPNTSAADRANLLAAGAAFEKGDYAKAQSQFDTILKGNSEAGIKAQAAFGVASSLEAQKNLDGAIQKYEEVARNYPKENVAPQAKLAIGRIYEAQNKPAEALKLYSDIQNQQDQFEYWQNEATQRKERIVAAHPELKEQAAAGAKEQIIEVTTPPAPGATNK